jgi:hypothetical protein
MFDSQSLPPPLPLLLHIRCCGTPPGLERIIRNFCRASRHAVSIARVDGVMARPGPVWARLAPPKGCLCVDKRSSFLDRGLRGAQITAHTEACLSSLNGRTHLGQTPYPYGKVRCAEQSGEERASASSVTPQRRVQRRRPDYTLSPGQNHRVPPPVFGAESPHVCTV